MMHDPMTVILDLPFGTLWHVDPCKDGSDDSCGWHLRARHGKKETLKSIISAFDFDWDRVFKSDSKNVYYCGYFTPEGKNIMSPIAIAVNLFSLAAYYHFGCRRKANKFLQKNTFNILHFAENPTDSMYNSVVRKFGIDERESRDDRIESFARMIYGCVLNWSRPWWNHPNFHFWHYKFTLSPEIRNIFKKD